MNKLSTQDPELIRELIAESLTDSQLQGRGERCFGFYWTRKSSSLAQFLVEKFSGEKSVVLDPFMGSGSTGLGVLGAGGDRLFIGSELNEMPIRSFEATVSPHSVLEPDELRDARRALKDLRDLYVFDIGSTRVELVKIIHRRLNGVLEATSFVGLEDGKRMTYSESDKPDKYRKLKLAYESRIGSFKTRPSTTLDENPRIAIKQGQKVSDFFGPLGFEALEIFRESKFSRAKQLVMAGGLHLCRLTDSRSQSQFPFWHPRESIHEQSVFTVLSKQIKDLEIRYENSATVLQEQLLIELEGWRKVPQRGAYILSGPCSKTLERLPNASVDLVLTDPPYFDQVAYSEYLKLWEFFTGFHSNVDEEIVESSRVGNRKSRQDFLDDLLVAFRQIRRVTKDSGIALVYFKDSKPRNLHDFIYTLELAGFRFLTQSHIAKNSFTYKQNATVETTVGGDSIMVFVAGMQISEEPTASQSLAELDSVFINLMASFLAEHGPTQLTEILDARIIFEMYPLGYLKKIRSLKHLVDLAQSHFKFNPETREWSLP